MTFYRGDPDRNWPLGKSRLPLDYRKEVDAKFNSTAGETPVPYNPEITYYYNSSNTIIKVEEVFNGKKYIQTISGTGNYANQTVSYYAKHSAWEETTIS